MNARLNRNMALLAQTITGVVRNMSPSMICMCEVGEVRNLLSENKMEQVVAQVISAWRDAATEHVKLHSMIRADAPYVTVYIDGPIRCSQHRILKDLYNVAGESRTAQSFVCSLPSGECMDVVNAHAP